MLYSLYLEYKKIPIFLRPFNFAVFQVNEFTQDNEEKYQQDEEAWRPTSGGQIGCLGEIWVDFQEIFFIKFHL